MWEYVSEGSTGTNVRRRLHPDDFLRTEILIPSLAEQRRIVRRIEDLVVQIDEAQDLRRRAAAEADDLVTSVHTSLAGKRTRTIREILELDEDAQSISPIGSYPQVGVRSFGGGLFSKAAVSGGETTYATFNRLYEGALVLSQVKGWEGAVAVCPTELAGWFVSPEYRTFRCIATEARPDYLASLVRTGWFWSKLGDAARGVGARRERARPEHFLDIELEMPDVGQQEQGEKTFAEINALKIAQPGTAAELNAFMPSLLDRAFAGKL
jgi:type I restriction enzyme, S subunit